MPPIEAIYENGVFRPLRPIDLPEGARVEVFAVAQGSQATYAPVISELDETAMGDELSALLERIDSLPLESEPAPDLSTTYRDVLYPRHGKMP